MGCGAWAPEAPPRRRTPGRRLAYRNPGRAGDAAARACSGALERGPRPKPRAPTPPPAATLEEPPPEADAKPGPRPEEPAIPPPVLSPQRGTPKPTVNRPQSAILFGFNWGFKLSADTPLAVHRPTLCGHSRSSGSGVAAIALFLFGWIWPNEQRRLAINLKVATAAAYGSVHFCLILPFIIDL